jgi:hypothetical protein
MTSNMKLFLLGTLTIAGVAFLAIFLVMINNEMFKTTISIDV